MEQSQLVLTPTPLPITSTSPVIKPLVEKPSGPVSKPSYAAAYERPLSAVAHYGPQRAEVDSLGKSILEQQASFDSACSPRAYFRSRQGRGDLTRLHSVTHPAKHLLQRLSKSGAPVVLSTPPWSTKRLDEAIRRGPHKSALEHLEFLRGEMADMVDKAFWSVLPYSKVRHLKNLRISPIGVVPQPASQSLPNIPGPVPEPSTNACPAP